MAKDRRDEARYRKGQRDGSETIKDPAHPQGENVSFGQDPDYLLGYIKGVGEDLTDAVVREAYQELRAGRPYRVVTARLRERSTKRSRIVRMWSAAEDHDTHFSDEQVPKLALSAKSLGKGYAIECSEHELLLDQTRPLEAAKPDPRPHKRLAELSIERKLLQRGVLGAAFVLVWLEDTRTGRTRFVDHVYAHDYAVDEHMREEIAEYLESAARLFPDGSHVCRVGCREVFAPGGSN
jgi:hypothetical protein